MLKYIEQLNVVEDEQNEFEKRVLQDENEDLVEKVEEEEENTQPQIISQSDFKRKSLVSPPSVLKKFESNRDILDFSGYVLKTP
jgi:hypothetical protein